MLYNGPAIVDGDGELEIWAKAVVDIDDLDTDVVANAATPSLLRRKSAKHPPTAMHVEVHGHASSLLWRIDSHLDTACGIRDWDFDILCGVNFWTFGVKWLDERSHRVLCKMDLPDQVGYVKL
jgi:hypothetical protein